MDQKNNKVNKLKYGYLFAFCLTALIIAPTHIFPQPLFMYARFPHYLEMMQPILNISWPATFNLYHYTLYALSIILSINTLSVLFYPRLRQIAIISSSIGAVLLLLIVLFFIFVFTRVNLSVSIVYGLYSMILLVVDLLTLKILLGSKKRQ
jgi:hypothetical protein